MLNKSVLKKINASNSQLVLVTKYFDKEKTREIFAKISQTQAESPLLTGEGKGEVVPQNTYDCILALGENRIDDIIKKKIPRDFCHFIGNIQSRKIREISENCSVIHSLCDLKHAEIFVQQKNKCKFFIQINISGEPQKQGILPENFAGFYSDLPKNLEIIGISGMGKNTFTREEKIAEFNKLLEIREKFNSNWKISAGTSADYEIALEMGIDIVRVGEAMFI